MRSNPSWRPTRTARSRAVPGAVARRGALALATRRAGPPAPWSWSLGAAAVVEDRVAWCAGSRVASVARRRRAGCSRRWWSASAPPSPELPPHARPTRPCSRAVVPTPPHDATQPARPTPCDACAPPYDARRGARTEPSDSSRRGQRCTTWSSAAGRWSTGPGARPSRPTSPSSDGVITAHRRRSTGRPPAPSTPPAGSSRPASSTSTPTSTPRSRGTRWARRRAATASRRWSSATAA